MAQTLEACRVMMGTSQRFKLAPDYYFCTAFWLLANQQLGSSSTWWESNAWYSERWPNGVLPVVRALQAEPKVARVAQTPPIPTVTLTGVIVNAPEQAVLELHQEDRLAARTRLEPGGHFSLPDLDAGRYVLRVEGTPLEQAIELQPDQGEVVIKLDAGSPADVVSRSVISGHVRGGAGAVVMLLREADRAEWVTMARDDGAFRFVDLPPGRYDAFIYPGGTRADGIQLDGRGEVQIELAVSGWGYTVGVASDVQKVGAIVISTPGHKGLRVQAHGADWSSSIAVTGEAVEYGQYAAIITPMEADYYIVTVDGVQDEHGRPAQLEARVHVDKRSIPLVEFVFIEPPAAHVPHAAAAVAAVSSGQDRAQEPVQEPAQLRRDMDVPAHGEDDVAAPGSPETEPQVLGGPSSLSGFAPDGAGRDVHIIDAVGNERWTTTDAEGHFIFEQLPAGVYSVFVDGGYQQGGVVLDGTADVDIFFAPVIAIWETTITNAGSMPGFSSVRIEVEGMTNLPVRIWQGEEEGRRGAYGRQPGGRRPGRRQSRRVSRPGAGPVSSRAGRSGYLGRSRDHRA